MTPPRWFWFVLAACLLAFLVFVWPSVWIFSADGERRVNRFTGVQEWSGHDGWHRDVPHEITMDTSASDPIERPNDE